MGVAFRECFVDADKRVKNSSFARRQAVETCLKTFLQIFQNERDEADVGDFVFGEGFADIFGPHGAKMNDGSATDKGAEEADHEVDGVIGRKDAEVAETWSEGIDRSEGDALLEIVFVGHHAAFGAAAGAGGVDDGGDVAALAWDEGGFASSAKFFPALRAGEIGVWRGFGNEERFQIYSGST